MASKWLYLYSPDAVWIMLRDSLPAKAFDALSIVRAREVEQPKRERVGFVFEDEAGSCHVNLNNPKLADIVDLLELCGDGLHMLVWSDKKPKQKRATDRTLCPVKRDSSRWLMCSNRPPYHALLRFDTATHLAQGIVNRMVNS